VLGHRSRGRTLGDTNQRHTSRRRQGNQRSRERQGRCPRSGYTGSRSPGAVWHPEFPAAGWRSRANGWL